MDALWAMRARTKAAVDAHARVLARAAMVGATLTLVGLALTRDVRRLDATAAQRKRRRRELRAALDRASTYEEFEDAANELERLDEEEDAAAAGGRGRGAVPTSWASGSRAYDVDLIEEQLRQLRTQRAAGNVEEMMFLLRADILRNLGSLTSPSRVSVAADASSSFGVPRAVREYIS